MTVENATPEATPAVEATPSPVAAIAEKLGMAVPEKAEKTNVVRAIHEGMKARRGIPAESPKEDKPAESPKTDTPAPEPEKKPEPEAEKPLERAKHLQALAKAEKSALEHKTAREAAEKRWAEAESLAKSNPIKAMEKLSGMSFKDIMAEAAKGKYDVKPLDPELDARLKKIEEFEEKQRKQHEEQATAAQRAADSKLISEFLTSRADEYPLYSGLEWAQDQLLEMAYDHLKETGEQPDLASLAADQETKAVEGLVKLLANEKVKNHPKLKSFFGAAPAALPTKSQPSLSNATAGEAPAPKPSAKPASDEISPETVARFQAMKRRFGATR